MAGVKDIAGDQGGRVDVMWNASWLDTDPSQVVDHYWVMRALHHYAPPAGARPLASAASMVAGRPRPGGIFTSVQGGAVYYWESLAYVQANHSVPGYSYVAPTTGDSTGAYNPRTYFMVMAWNNSQTEYWSSARDSGYSVDNLPPFPPAPFTGQY